MLLSPILTTTTGTSRLMNNRLLETVYARDFGAVGDGVTDDTSAIQAAIDSLTTIGGTFRFGRGTFKITAPLTYPANKISIYGEGQQATILKPTGDVAAAIVFGNASSSTRREHLRLGQLKIDGTDCTATGRVGVKLRMANRFTIDHVWCIRFNDGTGGAGFWFSDENWIGELYRCRTQDNYYGVRFKPSSRSTQVANQVNIIGGEYGAGDKIGICIGDETASTNQSPVLGYKVLIQGVSIEGAVLAGLWNVEATSVSVIGSSFEQNDGYDIRLGTTGGCSPTAMAVAYCYFTNVSTSMNHYGVYADNVNELDAEHNRYDFSAGGFTSTGVKVIAGNKITLGPSGFGASVTTKYDVASGITDQLSHISDISGYSEWNLVGGKVAWALGTGGPTVELVTSAGVPKVSLSATGGLIIAKPSGTGSVISVIAVGGAIADTPLMTVTELGLVRAGAGSANAPGLSFLGDTNTGFYNITTDQLAITCGGTLQCQWTNGTLIVADAKNYQFGTTTGTKIGTATAQKIGFWNATPVVQQILATGGGATVDNVISLLQTLGLCKQS